MSNTVEDDDLQNIILKQKMADGQKINQNGWNTKQNYEQHASVNTL